VQKEEKKVGKEGDDHFEPLPTTEGGPGSQKKYMRHWTLCAVRKGGKRGGDGQIVTTSRLTFTVKPQLGEEPWNYCPAPFFGGNIDKKNFLSWQPYSEAPHQKGGKEKGEGIREYLTPHVHEERKLREWRHSQLAEPLLRWRKINTRARPRWEGGPDTCLNGEDS